MNNTTPGVSRRHFIGAALAAPLVFSGTNAFASAPLLGVSHAPFKRVKLGSFEVTTLLAGFRPMTEPQNIFGMNVGADEFADASAKAGIPSDAFEIVFTPTLVNTGNELVLFDTGLDPNGIRSALGAAGYSPDQVDIVVLTHMHPDHIGGLKEGREDVFTNARYVTGAAEYNAWNGMENEGFITSVRPFAEKMEMIDPGASFVSGITAYDAFGHTPGHMGYILESDGKQLFIGADFANHFVWSLAYPDWEVRFDMDKAAAAATRKRVLGMLAADKIPFIGYHMPCPGIGYVETNPSGAFRYVAHSYQLHLE